MPICKIFEWLEIDRALLTVISNSKCNVFEILTIPIELFAIELIGPANEKKYDELHGFISIFDNVTFAAVFHGLPIYISRLTLYVKIVAE